MSSGLDKARQVLQVFDSTLDGLKAIQDLTKIGGDKARDALIMIDAIASALIAGFSGDRPPLDVKREIETLRGRIAATDAEIDRRARAKFNGEGNPE